MAVDMNRTPLRDEARESLPGVPELLAMLDMMSSAPDQAVAALLDQVERREARHEA